MRTEDQLRSALQLLEREAPDAPTVLRRVVHQPGAHQSRSRFAGLAGRRLVTGIGAAVAVIGVAVAALVILGLPGKPAATPAVSGLHQLPPYYLIAGPAHSIRLSNGLGLTTHDLLIKSTLTGKTLATIRPPGRYVNLAVAGGASDDRTFLLTAVAGASSPPYGVSGSWLEVAKFNPADGKVTLTRLDIPIVRTVGRITTIAGAQISPDGGQLAVAINTAGFVQLKVYSLATGAVRTWTDTAPPVSYPLTSLGGANLLTWARSGLLAFGWSYATSTGAYAALPQGMRLLNTNLGGGSLLADSTPFCLPKENGGAFYGQYLTADGQQIIAPVNDPVGIGQRPRRCPDAASGVVHGSRPAIEEFSVQTGRATAILGQFSWADQRTLAEQENLLWSNPAGTVLVVVGPAGSRAHPEQTLGVLSRGRFTPLPGAAGLRIPDAVAF
jgi:hypothetical protein